MDRLQLYLHVWPGVHPPHGGDRAGEHHPQLRLPLRRRGGAPARDQVVLQQGSLAFLPVDRWPAKQQGRLT